MRPAVCYLNGLRQYAGICLKPGRIQVLREKDDLNSAGKIVLDPTVEWQGKRLLAGIAMDGDSPPYYSKFERFMKSNGIHYEFFNIHGSDWIENINRFDVICWRPMSSPWELDEAREKIYFAENILKKKVYPSFREVFFYENKLLQYYILKKEAFPVIDTFISSDYDEVMNWLDTADYPLVSKLRTASASFGVSLLKNKMQAKIHAGKVFRSGKWTCWPHLKQKNYVFFQKFVENTGFDLRVIVIDEKHIFGYFRNVPSNDFRASGAGRVEKKELPQEAIKISLDVLGRLGFLNLAVDFLQSSADGKFHIIEASNFIKVNTNEQLEIKGLPGCYEYRTKTDSLIFREGRYWLQELVLKKFFEKNFSVPDKIPALKLQTGGDGLEGAYLEEGS